MTNVNATNDVVTNENDVDATTTHDVETNVAHDDATTTTTKTRATTRALNNVKMNKTQKSKTIHDDANNEILIVRTSTNALRIDHTMCYENNVHANDKNARSQCRARIARANAKK